MNHVTELTTATRRLTVDHDLCSGTGHCQDTAPGVFRLVERWAWLDPEADLTTADPGQLTRAEEGCPWMAITFQQKDGRP